MCRTPPFPDELGARLSAQLDAQPAATEAA